MYFHLTWFFFQSTRSTGTTQTGFYESYRRTFDFNSDRLWHAITQSEWADVVDLDVLHDTEARFGSNTNYIIFLGIVGCQPLQWWDEGIIVGGAVRVNGWRKHVLLLTDQIALETHDELRVIGAVNAMNCCHIRSLVVSRRCTPKMTIKSSFLGVGAQNALGELLRSVHGSFYDCSIFTNFYTPWINR